jgi:hypothetical protein
MPPRPDQAAARYLAAMNSLCYHYGRAMAQSRLLAKGGDGNWDAEARILAQIIDDARRGPGRHGDLRSVLEALAAHQGARTEVLDALLAVSPHLCLLFDGPVIARALGIEGLVVFAALEPTVLSRPGAQAAGVLRLDPSVHAALAQGGRPPRMSPRQMAEVGAKVAGGAPIPETPASAPAAKLKKLGKKNAPSMAGGLSSIPE